METIREGGIRAAGGKVTPYLNWHWKGRDSRYQTPRIENLMVEVGKTRSF
jgi:hypothetical protein